MSSVLASIPLAAIARPPGLTLAEGGTRDRSLPFSIPPEVPLDARGEPEMLAMLDYAGIRYASPDSPAAAFGLTVFRTARDFAQQTAFERITFDWDHTLNNCKIFHDVRAVIRARSVKREPSRDLARAPMVAVEIARPFMHEIAFGAMIGYACRQGLKSLRQWEKYEPQVGLVTHTWPDRIGVLAQHFMPLIPLMEGLLPGSPHTYERIAFHARAIVHLHHFLWYASGLMERFEKGGFTALSPPEQDEVMAYCADGNAHDRKPVGALAARGWKISRLLHFDDSTMAIADLENHAFPGIRAIHVRQPHSNVFSDVQERNKIALSGLWRRREATAVAVVRDLARMEWKNSTVPAIVSTLAALGGSDVVAPDEESSLDLEKRTRLPAGVVLTVHETPATVGEFWRYYVMPTDALKQQIRGAIKKRGGLAAIRADHRRAVGRRAPVPEAVPGT